MSQTAKTFFHSSSHPWGQLLPEKNWHAVRWSPPVGSRDKAPLWF